MSSPARARILLADDHSLVRAGFRSILGDEDDIDVVGEAKDGAEAVEAAVRALGWNRQRVNH